MTITRRGFLKALGVTTTTAAVGPWVVTKAGVLMPVKEPKIITEISRGEREAFEVQDRGYTIRVNNVTPGHRVVVTDQRGAVLFDEIATDDHVDVMATERTVAVSVKGYGMQFSRCEITRQIGFAPNDPWMPQGDDAVEVFVPQAMPHHFINS